MKNYNNFIKENFEESEDFEYIIKDIINWMIKHNLKEIPINDEKILGDIPFKILYYNTNDFSILIDDDIEYTLWPDDMGSYRCGIILNYLKNLTPEEIEDLQIKQESDKFNI